MMPVLKRILAIMVMVISSLVLVLSLASVAGVWIVRDRLASSLTGIVRAAETRTAAVEQRVDQLDSVLTTARAELAEVEQAVQALGANVEANKPLLTAISDRLSTKLSSLSDRLGETVTTIREAVATVNGVIEVINAIPFLDLSVPELKAPDQLLQSAADIQTEIQVLRTTADQRRSEILDGAVAIISTPASKLGNTLGEIEASIAGFREHLAAVQARLSVLEASIPRWLTWAAMGLTLCSLWIAFSQIGLLLLARRSLSGLDRPAQKQPQPQPV